MGTIHSSFSLGRQLTLSKDTDQPSVLLPMPSKDPPVILIHPDSLMGRSREEG